MQQQTARRSWPRRAVWFAALFLAWAAVWVTAYATRPGPATGDIAVIIPKKTGFIGIRAALFKAGVIDSDPRFFILARIIGVGHRLRAGEYLFAAGATPYQVLLTMRQGKIIQHAVTIPEGLNLKEIADILAADGWIDRERFLALTSDAGLRQELGIEAATLEGYLFPDTYNLARENQDEAGIIRMMTARFFTVYDELCGDSARNIPLSRHALVTLASIVEKEAALPEERPLIAGVFFNRLQQNMRLQADPTVKYGRGDEPGRLTYQDLAAPLPYNTYFIYGLPPGPIASPGRAAIAAVLNPSNEDYLYFVARNDGSHCFSKTLEEHNRAVMQYQK